MVEIVIAEDDQDTLDTLTTLCELDGIHVVGKGHNGKEAVELYKEKKPDVILLDMKMPEYDGKYAVENILKEDPDAKIMVVTGFNEYDELNGEVAWFFYKPYDFATLKEAIYAVAECEPKIKSN